MPAALASNGVHSWDFRKAARECPDCTNCGFRNEVGECFVHAHMSALGWEQENGTTAHAHHPQSGSWGDAIPATLSSFSKAAERAATTCPTCPSKVTEGCYI